MKKSVSILLAFVLMFVLASCGGGTGEPQSEDTSGDVTQAEDPVVLKIGSTVQDNSAAGQGLIEDFKPYIEEKSNGRIIVEVYNNSVLGGDRQLFEALQLGTVQASCGPLSVLANFEPKFGAADLPFLYKDKETAYAALDGEWGDLLRADLPKVGMRLLGYCENAFRNLSNNKKPIETLADLKGMKMRVMESPVHISTFKALGANPTPVAFSELYTALQQGTVDGQDNGIALTYTAKLYEVQKYYTISGQCYAAAAIVVSEKWWQSLDPELQQIIQDGTDYFKEKQRARNAQMEKDYLELMKQAGMQVNELSPEVKNEFMKATQPVWDEMAATVGEDIIAAAREVNEKYGN